MLADDAGHRPRPRHARRRDLRPPHPLPTSTRSPSGSSCCPTTSTRCSASTSRTWARSAPTGCCTPPPTCAAPTCGRSATGCRGRRVAVVGGGVVGLLTALFARRHGAAEVVVLDPTPQRRAAAEGLGLAALDPDARDPAVLLKTRWRHGPADRGADVVFQCRGRSAALAAGAAPAAPAGHRDRPGLLHRRRLRPAARRRVPPQRARRPLRADRAGATRHEPRLGPRAALGRDRRPAARRRRSRAEARGDGRAPVRRGTRAADRPRRPPPARDPGGADVATR